MTMTKIKIGSKVDYKTTGSKNFMTNGVVTGIDKENNRAFVTWPIQGVSSISMNNLMAV